MSPADPRWSPWQPSDAIGLVSVLISLALFYYTRWGDHDPRFILDLGLVYMVLMSAAVGQILHSDHVPASRAVVPVISWLGALVLVTAYPAATKGFATVNHFASSGDLCARAAYNAILGAERFHSRPGAELRGRARRKAT
jgi:hypothetical protein